MREIKFRAVSYFKKAIYHQNEDEDLWAFLRRVHGMELMQFTGLYDMYEKEVYEGDILKAYGYGNLSGKWEVKFVDGEWKALSINNLGFSLDAKYFEHTELIGNIYENPELI